MFMICLFYHKIFDFFISTSEVLFYNFAFTHTPSLALFSTMLTDPSKTHIHSSSMCFISKLQRKKYTVLVCYYTIYTVTKCEQKNHKNPYLEWWPLCKDANAIPLSPKLLVNHPSFKC